MRPMPRLAKKAKVKRLNLELKIDVRNRMEELRDLTDADTLVEVVRRALAVYDYVWTQKKEGARILVEDSEGTRELVIL
jgi:hypothetical protein